MEGYELVLSLYGSEVRYDRTIAFCRRHNRYLTVNQMKKHKCLAKCCPLLKRFNDRQFWIDRKARKQKKKLDKLNEKYI